jgi:tetratricopeptide (TPR) repeat protein
MGFLDFLPGRRKSKKVEPEASKHFKTFLEQGRIELESRSFEKAVEYFDKAIAEAEKTPGNPVEVACVQKARALDGLGQFKESEMLYDKAFEIKPDYSWIWFMRGQSYADQGLNEKAFKYFDKSFELDPMFEDPMLAKATMYGKMGKEDKQVECYLRILQANPNNTEVKQKMEKIREEAKVHKNRQWLGGITKGMKLREDKLEEEK